jgi:uncharacterized membrane protein YbhN (UPF0104 family)
MARSGSARRLPFPPPDRTAGTRARVRYPRPRFARDDTAHHLPIRSDICDAQLDILSAAGEEVSDAAPRWTRLAAIASRLALLVAACWALRRELAGVAPHELASHLAAYGPRHVLLALACTVGSFVVLGLVEMLALRQASAADAGPSVVPRRVAMTTAFVANALSQSVGLSLLTGAAVRLRAYARRGLDAISIGRVTAFATLTTTLGLIATAAAALLTSAEPIRVRGATLPVRPVGVVLALLVIAYLGWGALGRRDTLGRGRWRVSRPSLGGAAAQMGLSTRDWILAGTVRVAFVPARLGSG